MIQFVAALVMGLNAIRIGCDFPMWMQVSFFDDEGQFWFIGSDRSSCGYDVLIARPHFETFTQRATTVAKNHYNRVIAAQGNLEQLTQRTDKHNTRTNIVFELLIKCSDLCTGWSPLQMYTDLYAPMQLTAYATTLCTAMFALTTISCTVHI